MYQLAFRLAMEIYEESKKFRQKKYSSPTKSEDVPEAWQQILGRATEESSTQRCFKAKCRMPTAKERKLKRG
jgi:hypothetical protein